MKHKLFIILTLSVFITACGGSVATSNQNVNANANIAVVSAPTPEPTPELPAEVPTFDNAQAALDMGKQYFAVNRDANAVNAFEQAIKLEPTLAEAHLQLGLAYDALTVEAMPDDAKKYQETAEKSYKEAIKLYQKVTAKNSKDAAAFLNLGRAFEKINEDQKAEKALRQAVKLQPEDTEYRYEFGAILFKLAQYTESVRELKKAIELDPQNTRAEVLLERAEAGELRVKDAKAKNKKAADAEKAAGGRTKPDKSEETPEEEEAPKPTTKDAPKPAAKPATAKPSNNQQKN